MTRTVASVRPNGTLNPSLSVYITDPRGHGESVYLTPKGMVAAKRLAAIHSALIEGREAKPIR